MVHPIYNTSYVIPKGGHFRHLLYKEIYTDCDKSLNCKTLSHNLDLNLKQAPSDVMSHIDWGTESQGNGANNQNSLNQSEVTIRQKITSATLH